MPTTRTHSSLPKPSAIREAIKALHSLGVIVWLHSDGISFGLPTRDKLRGRNIGPRILKEEGRVLTDLIRDFGLPVQIHEYDRLGYNVSWEGVEDSGEWTLRLLDRRPDGLKNFDDRLILIDAHYESE